MISLCLVLQCGIRVTPLDFCLRVIVNEKPLNLKYTTFSALSALLLIYGLHIWLKCIVLYAIQLALLYILQMCEEKSVEKIH